MELTEDMAKWNKNMKESREKNRDSEKVNPFSEAPLSTKIINE